MNINTTKTDKRDTRNGNVCIKTGSRLMLRLKCRKKSNVVLKSTQVLRQVLRRKHHKTKTCFSHPRNCQK